MIHPSIDQFSLLLRYGIGILEKPVKCMALFSTLREPSVDRKDLRVLTLVGPPRDNPELDPLAVIHLDN